MSDVRPLTEADFDAFISIVANAYPDFSLGTAEEREALKQRFAKTQFENPLIKLYGLFREGTLLGGMQLFDFTMNMASVQISIGGVGLVAVDFFHKKEKVAKEMIAFFLRHYRERGAPMTALYPFRPDFYKQMGFGYGTKMNQYRVKPSSLPAKGERHRVRPLVADDKARMLACYTRVFEQTHGLFAKYEHDFSRIFENTAWRVVGYGRGEDLAGYCVFQFVKGAAPRTNDIEMVDLVYEDREALAGLLAFLQSQADQIPTITFNTQDALFHHLLLDPRSGGSMLVPPISHESNTAGIGIMYRVVDTPGVFRALAGRSFGGQTCALKLSVVDTLLPENNGSVVVHFRDGRPHIQENDDYEVEIRLDVAEFSSLLMGVVPFRNLYLYGLAELSDPAFVATIDQLFAMPTPPVCMSRF